MTELNFPVGIAILIFGLAILYWTIPLRFRRYLVLAISFGMLLAVNSPYALFIVLQVTLTFTAVSFFPRKDPGSNKLIFILILTWLSGCLLAIKLNIGAAWEIQTLATVGISYITFRLVHYVVAAQRGDVSPRKFGDFLDLLSHVLFFPSLIAGPVLRYEAWSAQKPENARFNLQTLNLALLRILTGIIKKFALSDQLNLHFVIPVFDHPAQHSSLVLAAAVCADTLRIYFDFSGYSDIAIGIAALFGYQLPENFNFPLLKSNIAEFWRNWHITLHDFIRDHFFIPFFAFRSSQTKIYLGLICTMILMMVWHAFSWGFLILGLLHGFALAFWHFLQELKRRNRGLANFFSNWPMRIACTILTFLFCSFTFILGFRGLDSALTIYSLIAGFPMSSFQK